MQGEINVIRIYSAIIVIDCLLLRGDSKLASQPEWGYGPSGGIGLVLLILVVLMLMGRL